MVTHPSSGRPAVRYSWISKCVEAESIADLGPHHNWGGLRLTPPSIMDFFRHMPDPVRLHIGDAVLTAELHSQPQDSTPVDAKSQASAASTLNISQSSAEPSLIPTPLPSNELVNIDGAPSTPPTTRSATRKKTRSNPPAADVPPRLQRGAHFVEEEYEAVVSASLLGVGVALFMGLSIIRLYISPDIPKRTLFQPNLSVESAN